MATSASSKLSSEPDDSALTYPVRIAAIDIGSNSIRLIVADVQEDSSYRVIDDERELARLGAALASTGRLPENAMDIAMVALRRMREIADGFRVKQLRCIATSAVREATNGPLFVQRVARETGLDIEVVSSDREARLAYRSISRQFDLRNRLVAAMDIGGGSAQLILAADGVVENVYPFKLGAVRLASEFTPDNNVTVAQYQALRSYVREQLLASLTTPPFHPELLIGTGGTFTTLGQIFDPGAASDSSSHVQGVEVFRAQLRHTLDRLWSMTSEKRRNVPGLPADRADIIVPGLCVVDETMEILGINRTRVHEGGVRDGLLNEMIRDLLGSKHRPAAPAHDSLRSVRKFAERCRYDQDHAEHTLHLACSVFDQLCDQLALYPDAESQQESRLLLRAGAILHDIGYLVNYSAHHKHSYHLIANADLEGLSKRQIEIIANIARYHRKSEPKKSHTPYAALDAHSREQVWLLAGILRIAAGLNRTRTRVVQDVKVRVDTDGSSVLFQLHAAGPADAELWGAQRKDDVLRCAIERCFEFEIVHTDTNGMCAE